MSQNPNQGYYYPQGYYGGGGEGYGDEGEEGYHDDDQGGSTGWPYTQAQGSGSAVATGYPDTFDGATQGSPLPSYHTGSNAPSVTYDASTSGMQGSFQHYEQLIPVHLEVFYKEIPVDPGSASTSTGQGSGQTQRVIDRREVTIGRVMSGGSGSTMREGLRGAMLDRLKDMTDEYFADHQTAQQSVNNAYGSLLSSDYRWGFDVKASGGYTISESYFTIPNRPPGSSIPTHIRFMDLVFDDYHLGQPPPSTRQKAAEGGKKLAKEVGEMASKAKEKSKKVGQKIRPHK